MSKGTGPDLAVGIYEWSHRHFPNFIDCRPIYVRRAIERAGFAVSMSETMHIWVPVEIVAAVKRLADD
jgi:demethylmenaquinone methyltransferase/2-methoxy-6-polyprenyl-1,4-benzoquinol methylase